MGASCNRRAGRSVRQRTDRGHVDADAHHSAPAIPLFLRGALMRMAYKLCLCALLFAGAAATLYGVAEEAQSSRLQAGVLSRLARGLRFSVEPGQSDAIRFPGPGPYDQRRGYAQLPVFIDRLKSRD